MDSGSLRERKIRTMDGGPGPGPGGDGIWVETNQRKQQRKKKQQQPRKLSKTLTIPTTRDHSGYLISHSNKHGSSSEFYSHSEEQSQREKKKPLRKLSKHPSNNTLLSDGGDFFSNDTAAETSEAEEEDKDIPPPRNSYSIRSFLEYFDNEDTTKTDEDNNNVNNNNVQKVEVMDDIYSMMYFAPWYSFAFWYAIVVHYIQVVILWLAIFDLVDIKDLHQVNLLNVPPTATTQVFVAQFLALLVAALSQDDITHSLNCASIGVGMEYPKIQKKLQKKYRNAATTWQFWLSNTLRFLEGGFTLITSFVFIVQSQTVLDIFLNFAAIEFVSELDNLGFRLAKEGWFGKSLRELNQRISEEEIPLKKKRGFIDYFNQLLLFLTVLCMFIGNGIIVHRQKNGIYIQADACSVLDVRFGNDVYEFPTSASLQTYEVNGTFYVGGSSRYIYHGGDPSDPPPLRYGFFSGRYKPSFEDNKVGRKRNNQRPVYYEASKIEGLAPDLPHDDSSVAFFYYCEEETAWVWTVRAFIDAGAVPQETLNRCKYGWLLRSPITEAVTLEEAPSEGWDVWTGVLSTTDLSTSCLECKSDIDCGLNRGTCGENDKVCHCHDFADGYFCNEDQPCSTVVGFLDGQAIFPPYFFMAKPSGYASYIGAMPDWHFQFVYHVGVHWTLSFTSGKRVEPKGGNLDSHGYWYSGYLNLDYWYTDPSNSAHPTSVGLQWYKGDETRFVRDERYGPKGRKIPIDFHLECLSVDCDGNHGRVCGKFGRCVKGQNLTVAGYDVYNFLDNGTQVVGGKCICDEGYYGHYCEFKNVSQGTAASNFTKDEL